MMQIEAPCWSSCAADSAAESKMDTKKSQEEIRNEGWGVQSMDTPATGGWNKKTKKKNGRKNRKMAEGKRPAQYTK